MGVCITKNQAIHVPQEVGPIIQSAIHKSVIVDSKAQVDIHKFYRFNAVIGHGHFGTVREAYRFNNETVPFAVKSICKENIKRDLYLLKREIDILMHVDHPNIIKYYESYEDDKYIHIVMEMCTGGDLLDKAATDGVMSEEVLAPLMRKIFAAVNHLHGMFICHRDLKPENVLFTTKDLTADIKLLDFGMSAMFGEDVTTMTTMVGTPHYLAPEVLSSKYGKECDVWSLGIIIYFLLTGCYPFDGKTLNSIFQAVLKAEFDFSGPEWENVSSECKDLVSKMLLVEPTHRITLVNALKHKWILASHQAKPQEISRAVLRNLKAFKPLSKLQQEAMKVIVKNLSSEEIVDLKNQFTALDTNDTGFVSAQDLETAMFRAGFNISAEDIRSKGKTDLVHSVDELQQKGMKYSNFIMATLDRKKFIDREVIYMAFKHLDYVRPRQDNDGFITTKDLKTAMEIAGGEFSDLELQEMINEFDMKGDRKIDLEEFSEMMASNFQSEVERDRQPNSAMSSGLVSRRSSLHVRMSLLSGPFA